MTPNVIQQISAWHTGLVGIGGFFGAVARYKAGSFLVHRYPAMQFPISTFAVNVAGCLLIGLFAGLSVRHSWFGPEMKLLLVSGFLGGFTTFSAFGLETMLLLERKDFLLALGNVLSSVAVCLFAVWIGLRFGQRL